MNEEGRRITVEQTSKILQMDKATIRYGIEKQILPIGYYVRKKGKKRGMYIIYADLVDKFRGKTK